MIHPLALGALVAGALFTIVWLASIRVRDVSLVDRFWGPGFALLANSYALLQPNPRAFLVSSLVTIWGLRLGWHIHRRNQGHAEDPRYAAMRARSPRTFPWTSLVTVFALQAMLQWVVALPLWAVARPAAPTPQPLDALGLALWLTGFAFESIGDAQLRAFKRDPANKGRLMTTGLWSWTRHPNYFGDACIWWGFAVFAIAAEAPLWVLLGPLVMTVLLTSVSGVTMLEATMRHRAGWEDYAKRTSAFLPLPPRRG